VFPEFAYGTGRSGSLDIPVGTGYEGLYSAGVNGLHPPCVLPATIEPDKSCTNTGSASVTYDAGNQYSYQEVPSPESGITRFTIKTEASDNELLRIALISADPLTDGAADLDLYLYSCKVIPGVSCVVTDAKPYEISVTHGTTDEFIEILKPRTGGWMIDVHGYDTADGNPAEFRLYVWAFGSDEDKGNLRLENVPLVAQPGVTTDIKASWDNLPDGLWLGGLTHYGNDGAFLGMTVIEVDSNAFPE
jgi:hypothetical protein